MLRLRIAPGVIHAEASLRRELVWVGEAPFDDPAGLSGAIAALAAAPSVPCRRLVVTIAPPLVQLRTIAGLPPVRPALLAGVVSHQACRFFRKNGVPLVTDAVWVSNGGAPLARAAAIGEPVVEAIAAGARAAGLVLETISVADDTAHLELLPAGERAARRRSERTRLRNAWAAAAALLIAALAVYVMRLSIARSRVNEGLAASQEPLEAVVTARRELRVAELTLLAARRATNSRGYLLSLLAQLTRALPDSAVITSLTLRDDGSGMLSGLARRASPAVARLESSPPFRRARLQGPVSRETVNGRDWERFTVEWQP